MKESISDIVEECSRLTLEQKNSEEISSFTSALFLLCGLELLAIVALYIREGFSNKILFFLATLLLMLFMYKWKLSQADNAVKKLTPTNQLEGSAIKEKLEYLNAGLDMKLTRIRNIRWFYIIVFPVFLLNVQQLCKGVIETTYNPWQLPVIFICSYLVWSWFFKADKEGIEIVKKRVSYLNGILQP